jgi:hypothetical protein
MNYKKVININLNTLGELSTVDIEARELSTVDIEARIETIPMKSFCF